MTENADPEDGVLLELDGRRVLRFERFYPYPIDRVWQALTRPEQLQQWVGANEVRIELRPGGVLETRTTGPADLVEAIIREAGEAALQTRDTVLAVEPPRLFEHTFGGVADSVVRWELSAESGGCRLRLTHTEPAGFDPADAPRDLAGWHELLQLLRGVLDGEVAGPWSPERWEQHRDRYATRLDQEG